MQNTTSICIRHFAAASLSGIFEVSLNSLLSHICITITMLSVSSSDSIEFDRFFADSFGDDGAFFDDLSLSFSEDSYDSCTTRESFSSDEPLKKKTKYQPRKPKLLSIGTDVTKIKQWELQQQAQSIPKVMKSDVRRSYASIFSNCINILDFPLMLEFLKQFCMPTMIHAQTMCGVREQQLMKIQCPMAASYIETSGILNVAQFWYNKFQGLPDVVYRLVDTKIRTFSNTEASQVVSTFKMSATRLFDAPFHMIMPNAHKVVSCIEDNNENISSNSSEIVSVKKSNESKKRSLSSSSSLVVNSNANNIIDLSMIDDSFAKYLTTAPMLSEPIEIKSTIELTMFLNANKVIEKMQFQCDV